MNFMNFMNFVRDLAREDVIVSYLLCSLGKINKSKGVSLLGAVSGELDQTPRKSSQRSQSSFRRVLQPGKVQAATAFVAGAWREIRGGGTGVLWRTIYRKYPESFQNVSKSRAVYRKFPGSFQSSGARACAKSAKTR
jgi:hypothetical protein